MRAEPDVGPPSRCIHTQLWPFCPFKLINEEHAGKPASPGGVNGIQMLLHQRGSGRSRCGIFCPSYFHPLPSMLVKQSNQANYTLPHTNRI